MIKLIFQLSILLFVHGISHALIRDVPSAYPTIQGALNSCQVNDTILVQPGTYYENLSWPSVNGIKLVSAGGPGQTIISAGSNGRALAISITGIDTSTHITGFTFTGGYLAGSSGYGAGIYITNAGIILEDVIVTGNRVYQPGGHGYGAGIYFDNSTSLLRNSIVSNNSIDSADWCYGAGIYISGGYVVLNDISISANNSNSSSWCYGVGIYARANGIVRMERVSVTGNFSGNNATWYHGTGIYLGNVTANLTNVLVADNHSGSGGFFNYGGGIYCDGNTCVVTLMNVTCAGNYKSGNAGITGSGIYVRDALTTAVNTIFYNPNIEPETATSLNGTLSFSFSDVRGITPGSGNIDTVPGFAAPGDYHLLTTSACAGSGTTNGAPFEDIENVFRPRPAGSMHDIGCYEVDQSVTSIADAGIPLNDFIVYPNPVISGNNFVIENTTGNIMISDNTGKIILTEYSKNKTQFSTGKWASGVYFIHSATGIVKRLIVLKK